MMNGVSQTSTVTHRVNTKPDAKPTDVTTDNATAKTGSMTADDNLDKFSLAGSSMDEKSDGADDNFVLRRKVGLVSAISFVVGGMIGSGIFISPKGVVNGCGSVGLSLIMWAVCGLVAMLGALCYIELGTMIHESGSNYTYLDRAYGDVIAFLYSWVSILLLRPQGMAIVALTCGEYLMAPFFDDGCGGAPAYLIKGSAILVILLITAVNCYSVKLASDIQIIFTVAKLLALIIIIIGGIVKLFQGYTEHLANGFEGTESNLGKIAMGFYSGMWAYEGWNVLNAFTEEVINPFKTIPRAVYIGIPLVTILYVFVNISYFTVMSTEEMLASPAVAWTWAEEVIPSFAWTMPLFVAMSTFGAANGSMFSSGRNTLVAARKKHMVKLVAMISATRITPVPSIIVVAILSVFMTLPTDLWGLLDYFSFVTWLVYGLVCAGLIIMRFTRKHDPRPYKVPLVIPAFICLLSVYLVIAPIVEQPDWGYLAAILVILAGLFLYFPFVVYDKTLPGLASFTMAMQLLLEVAPPSQLMELHEGMMTPSGDSLEKQSLGGQDNQGSPLDYKDKISEKGSVEVLDQGSGSKEAEASSSRL